MRNWCAAILIPTRPADGDEGASGTDERILALDIGDRRIGVAVSDPGRVLAQPVETYTRVGFGPDTRHILALCERYDTHLVVSGLPRNMDGTEGGQAMKAREFCRLLENAGLRVMMEDERLTTAYAERALIEGGMRRTERKGHIDQVAAVMILESFLQRTPEQGAEKGANAMQVGQTIELMDAEGNPCSFEHLMTLAYEDKLYLILCADGDPDDPEGSIVIMSIEKDDEGVDCYVPVEDGALLQTVYDLYVKTVEEEDDAAPDAPDSDD